MSGPTEQIEKGTRIRFLTTIEEGPDDHAPGRLFAVAGEEGTFLRYRATDAQHEGPMLVHVALVNADNWKQANFWCSPKEFEVIE